MMTTHTQSKDAVRGFLAQLESINDTDLLRSMLKTFVEELMSVDADNACNATHGERNPERTNQRNGRVAPAEAPAAQTSPVPHGLGLPAAPGLPRGHHDVRSLPGKAPCRRQGGQPRRRSCHVAPPRAAL